MGALQTSPEPQDLLGLGPLEVQGVETRPLPGHQKSPRAETGRHQGSSYRSLKGPFFGDDHGSMFHDLRMGPAGLGNTCVQWA